MIKKLYRILPYRLQNVMLTLANIHVLYKKYGVIPWLRPMRTIAEEVCREVAVNDDATLLERLNAMVAYATSHSRYYRQRQGEYRHLETLEALTQLPLLPKKVLKEQAGLFYSDESRWFNTAILHTSGTTGMPMMIKVSLADLRLRFRVQLKSMIACGFDPQKPLARISGLDIADAGHVFRKDYLNGHLFLSAFHLSQESVHAYYNAIVDHAIETLEGYPSFIYTMARLFECNGLHVSCVNHVFTTAEKLHKQQKETIERVFGCRVFDYYGSNEQSVLIFTCKNNRLHTADATGIVEVLDEQKMPVPAGEIGGMVVTSFTSRFMPLIRYEIGDRCIVSADQACECGNGGIILDEIVGRDEEVFQTAQGKFITRFPVLRKLPLAVIESQLRLSRSCSTIRLFYVAAEEIAEENFSEFTEALLEKVGPEYRIEFIFTDHIAPSAKGKRKAVVIED